ncbi:MAG: Rne/Rng family ribonuclease [Actinomycetota bacterium]
MGVKQILIMVKEQETQLAILDGKLLQEVYVERRDTGSITGNIYLGRVQNVLQGMEAAFVDIGEARNAFLSADDIIGEGTEGDVGQHHREPNGDAGEHIGKKPKEIGVRKGQSALVQVTRAPRGSKGARLTTQIALPSRYMVLAPYKDFVGISRRIEGKERERLQKLATEIKPDNMGIIVRTQAEGQSKPTLIGDLTYLKDLWEKVQQDATKASPGTLVYREMDLPMKIIRDVFGPDVKRILVDDKEKYQEIVSYIGDIEPGRSSVVRYYRKRDPLFARYGVDSQINNALKTKIWLKSGGYLIIEDTEALTSIDVNTGRYVGRVSLEKTIIKTNLEAASEIGRQLRLRDIGGLIVVDFINMGSASDRDKVLKEFEGILEEDRAKSEVVEISRLGLIEMTRKSFTPGLLHAFTQKCPTCEGRGFVPKEYEPCPDHAENS